MKRSICIFTLLSVLGAFGLKQAIGAECVGVDTQTKWDALPGVFSTPAEMKDGGLVVGTVEGQLYFMDKQGSRKITVDLGAGVYAKPLVLKSGKVLVVSDDGKYRFFSPGGKELRKDKLQEGVYSAPIEKRDGYLALTGSDQQVHFLYPEGNERSTYATWGRIFSSPLELSNGSIVVTSTDHIVYVFNADGAKKNTFRTSAPIFSTPAALNDGGFVFGAEDGKVYFMNASGTLRATFSTGGSVFASPAVLKSGAVVVGSGDGKIYFLKPNGKLLASFPTKNQIFSKPEVMADQTVVIGTESGLVYFLNPDATLKASIQLSYAPWAIQSRSHLADGPHLFSEKGVAPADHYFGKARMSVLGIHSALVDISEKFNDPANFDKYINSLRFTEDAMRDWEVNYPEDNWIPESYFALGRAYEKVPTTEGWARSNNAKIWLLSRYFNGWYGQMARSKLAIQKLETEANAYPTVLSDGRIAVGTHGSYFYILKLNSKSVACDQPSRAP